MNKYGCDCCWIVIYHLVNNLLFTLCYIKVDRLTARYCTYIIFLTQIVFRAWPVRHVYVLSLLSLGRKKSLELLKHKGPSSPAMSTSLDSTQLAVDGNIIARWKYVGFFFQYQHLHCNFCDTALSQWSRLFDWYTYSKYNHVMVYSAVIFVYL